MKPRGDLSSSRSCSCTSSFYKTDSEHPSIRRMLAKSSRIDKLFIGKYLPLREEKLLHRLVRTRAIYNDIRTQLLSDSIVSESDRGDLKPAKEMPLKRVKKQKDKELSDAETSSVLLEFINLVDKGANLELHRLSGHCSCCVCGLKPNKFSEPGRPKKHKHMSSRSSFSSKMRTRDERRHVSQGHRARYIRSDPCNCTCTNPDCDLNIRSSKVIMKHDRKPGVASKETVLEQKVGGRHKIKRYKTRHGMGETFSRSITKLKKSKSQMSAKLRSKTKKSMEIIKATEQEIRGKIKRHTKSYKHSEILYSLRGGTRRKKTKEELELEVEDAIVKIKKDSLAKIREDMKNKKYLDKWACDFECDPEKCEPDECLRIKLQQKLQKDDKRVHQTDKNIGDTSKVSSKTRISQTKISEPVAKTEVKKEKIKSADLKKIPKSNEPQIKSKNKHLETETNKPLKIIKNKVICECKTITLSTNTSKRPVKSITKSSSTTTNRSFTSETMKQIRTKPKGSNVIRKRQRNVRSGGYALKRCFCTLKLRPKGNKPQRPPTSDSKSVQTKTSKTLSTSASTPFLQCDTMECLKMVKQRKMRTTNMRGQKHRTTGGSQSLQTHSSQKVEKLKPSKQLLIIKNHNDEPTSNKQAVKISSSFSLNIEFYKDTPSAQKIPASETRFQVVHSQKQTRKRHKKIEKHTRLAHKPSKITSSTKSNNTQTKHNLRRCFCTLKFVKKYTPETVTYSKGTLTSGQRFTEKSISRNTGTEKKLKRLKYLKYHFLPYECEPGLCVPGECVPYKCLEVINKRNAKVTNRCSGTCNRKTKSTYSISEKRGDRSKKVQSVPETHKEDKSVVMPQRKVTSSPTRQAVRFTSSFSFDVEFYKDKAKDTRQDIIIGKKTSSFVKTKTRGSKQKRDRKHQKSTSVQSNTKENEIFVGSAMKRCFCTLKLQKIAKKQAAIETVPLKDTLHSDMVTRSTQMIKENYRQFGISPAEIKIKNKKVKEFGTGTNKNKSSATIISSSEYRNALMQSNLGETRKKRKRSKYTTSSSYPNVPIPAVSKLSRQAVRIESNLSFNIEFAKNQPQEYQLPDEPIVKEPVRNVRIKQKGESTYETKLNHNESQSVALKKKDKGSRMKPILKRCFCTLKFQNNKANLHNQMITKPPETIVMPVQVFNKSFALYTQPTKRVVKKKKNQDDIHRLSFKLPLLMASKSNTTIGFNRNIKTLIKEKQEIRSLGNILCKEIGKTTELNMRRSQLIGIRPYLKNTFYALNLHVQNQQRRMHKLLPYECEPGVCIPGECDPHECLRLINKRLMKRSSTMTTTGNRSQSTPSGGTRVRTSQQQFGGNRQERGDKGRDKVGRAINYESTSPQFHEQAVRVGSTFGFNIEFFKDKSSPSNKNVDQEKRKKDHNIGSKGGTVRRNHKGTRGSQILRSDRYSQSINMPHNKGQNITRPKRCFCTLKLQKRGKQHVQVGHEAKPPLQYTNTGQNTKKRYNRLYDLDPNECEPGVCIPGQCDPYECLKRIKRRKNFGSGMRPSMMSSSSMTNQNKKHARGKQVQMKEKKLKASGSKSIMSLVSRPSVTKTSAQPSRQAVRIGSSFSFNVDFFKDRSYRQGAHMTASVPAPVKIKTRTKDYKLNTRIRRSPSSMGRSSQNSTTLHHQNIQHGSKMRAVGTKTGAFLKRCFCTANFFQKSPPNDVHVVGVPANINATPSLMQRCFCTLKLLTAKSKPKHAPKLTTGVSSQTNKIKEKKVKPMKLPKLEPYECEPGVCVPRQCDPYKCLERIHRRNRLNKMSSTENAGNRSTSTGFRSPKSAGSSARIRDHTKEKRHGDRKQKYAQPLSTPVVKPVTATSSLNRNVVRIGSNFSLNVEFYKDQISPTYLNVQRAAKEVKSNNKSIASTKARQKAKNRGVNKYGQSQSRESQADFFKKEDRATSMLKRCFCTLALHKQAGKDKLVPQRSLIVKEQGTESPYYKTYQTFENKNTVTKTNYKLKPYECEPGICIPNECEPYECLKRIQRRREQGMSTSRNSTSNSSTLMKQRRNLRDHHAQSATRHKKDKRRSQQRTRPLRSSQQLHYGGKEQLRQAVKIGTNLSFNIEFSKSRPGGDQTVKIRKEPRANRHETRSTSSKPEKRGSTRSIKSQGSRKVRDSDSQDFGNKVHSIVTETKPFLKRCFCTLKLMSNNNNNLDKKTHGMNKKPKAIKPSSVPKYTQSRDVGISTKKEKPFKNLLAYECEPGTCTPGQCDPNECLKRINKRNMHTKMAYTDKLRGRGVSTITAKKNTSSKGLQNQTNSKPKRSHARDGKVTPIRKQVHAIDKQAVRIGSSFNFDIEFSKDKPNKIPFHTDTPNVYSTLISTKNITTNRGYEKSKTAMSSINQKLINHGSQSITKKTASTGSRVSPLLKRCFCSLKLQKLGRQQRPSKLRTNSKVIKKAISTSKTINSSGMKYKDTGMGTKNRFRDLLPYECELNICVPGQCDPYKCLERIKRRNMCESTTNCMNRNTKTVSSLAERKSQIRKLKTSSDKSGIKKSIDIRKKYRRRNVILTKTNTIDRQAVRIGSNFSCNIEFYKEHTPKNFKNVTFDTLPKIDKVYNTRDDKLPKTISRDSFDQGQRTRHKQLVERVGQNHKASGIKPSLLQRCFCTLKLLEGNKQHRPLGSDVQVGHETKPPLQYTNTGQNTKKHHYRLSHLEPNECEQGVCIPGECDPYECLQRIKMRNIRHTATGVPCSGRCSRTSFTSFDPISKSKRIQYSTKNYSQKNQGAKISNIVEQPRFPFLESQYYQGLKIGSNVNVNFEFYKEYGLPTKGKETERIPRECKNMARNRYNQTVSKPNTYRRSSMKTNTFTRCRNFMQKADGVKTEEKSSFVGNALKRCFCTAKLVGRKSVITVGRVDKLITNSPFQHRKLQIYRMHQSKAKNRNKQTEYCDFNCTQNAATRINDKYFSGDPLNANQKNQNGNKNLDEMKTIFPYAPRKFNKNESKTFIMRKRNSNKKHCCAYCKATGRGNKEDAPLTKGAKRLTEKQDKLLITNQNGFKRFMCTCLNTIFKTKNKSDINLKSSFKIGDDDNNNTNKKFQADLKTSKSERKPSKKHENKIKKSKSLNNKKANATSLFVCQNCKAIFDNGDYKETINSTTPPTKEKDFNNISKISEVKKAGGDMKTSKNVKKTKEEKQKNKQNDKNKLKAQQGPCCFCKDEKILGKNNLDAKQYGLKLTKAYRKPQTQVTKRKTGPVKQITQKPEKPCVCGSSVCEKVVKKEHLKKKTKTLQKQKKKDKPCVCGSPVCAKEAKKMQGSKQTKVAKEDDKKTNKGDAKKTKTDNKKKKINEDSCICNVDCDCIDPSIKTKLDKEKQKRLKIKQAKDDKLLEARRKKYAKEDAILKKQRRAKDLKMYKQVLKTKNSGDCALLTESILDIAKLGCTTTGDVLRSTYRTVMDPKNTARNMQTCVRDPRRALANIKRAIGDSGLGSTCKRVALRITMMKNFKSAQETLETCPMTNYLIHVNDEDPKKRMKPKKKRRRIEEMDFECSPYMASLRKRPCLAVYHMCSWFYPHCLSMITIWRQFTDILMFLLAVVVWSPCILLMEGCRAMLCCFLCTG